MAEHSNTYDREAIAHEEIGKTTIFRSLSIAMTLLFLGMICIVPLFQHLRDIREARAGKRDTPWPQSLSILKPAREKLPEIFSPSIPWAARMAGNHALMQAMKDYEGELERSSFLTSLVLGPMQEVLSGWLGTGNEKAYVGKDGWLFYRPDVDVATGPGFLAPHQLAKREKATRADGSHIAANPLPAILEFRDQLKARGVELLLFIAPNKPSVSSIHFAGKGVPRNPSFGEFLERLHAEGIPVLDGSRLAAEYQAQTGKDAFLVTDTHWTPAMMSVAARFLAGEIEGLGVLPAGNVTWTTRAHAIEGEGDIVTMLKLSAGQTLFPREKEAVEVVLQPNGLPWTPDPKADVLLLGDSFTNIFSLPGMGWGAGAGFAEHLSLYLKRPVDCIVRNDAGSYATRELLSRDLAHGNDRLAGKKVLIWEFAERELASGDWKSLPMDLGAPPSAEGDFYAGPPAHASPLRVFARIARASSVPAEGSVPYADHVRSLHLKDLRAEDGTPVAEQALVYVRSMAKNRHTQAASWVAGDEITLDVQAWEPVEALVGSFNRSEFSEDAFIFATPVWGVPVQQATLPPGNFIGVGIYAGGMAFLLVLAILNARRIHS